MSIHPSRTPPISSEVEFDLNEVEADVKTDDEEAVEIEIITAEDAE